MAVLLQMGGAEANMVTPLRVGSADAIEIPGIQGNVA